MGNKLLHSNKKHQAQLAHFPFLFCLYSFKNIKAMAGYIHHFLFQMDHKVSLWIHFFHATYCIYLFYPLKLKYHLTICIRAYPYLSYYSILFFSFLKFYLCLATNIHVLQKFCVSYIGKLISNFQITEIKTSPIKKLKGLNISCKVVHIQMGKSTIILIKSQ